MNQEKDYPPIGEETIENTEKFRKFTGLWIPRAVWLSSLSLVEKCMLAEINSFSGTNDAFFMSNKYLASFFGLSENRIICIITKLEKLGLITRRSDGRRRFLFLTDTIADLVKTKGVVICKNARSDLVKTKGVGGVSFVKTQGVHGSKTAANPLQDKGLSAPSDAPITKRSIVKGIEKPPSALIQQYVCGWFTTRFPEGKITPAQIKESVHTVEELVRLDGYDLISVIKTLMWVTDKDCWWYDKVLSIAPLRHAKIKGDVSKFAKIYAQWEEQQDKSPSSTKLNTTQLDPDAQRLYTLAASILGDELVRKQEVTSLVATMEIYHTTLGSKFPNCTKHLNWTKFFNDWLEFLQEKQQSFPLQEVRQLKIGDIRWREFIQRCEHWAQYNFRTGVFQP